MTAGFYFSKKRLLCINIFLLAILLAVTGETAHGQRNRNDERQKLIPSAWEELDLNDIPFKIVYESYRETEGRRNWELILMNADGSNPVNLTNTPDAEEMYPHASPDGTKICFVVDEGGGRDKARNVYYMNVDGTERTRVAVNGRQPCWSSDSKKIAFLSGEYERYSPRIYATSGIVIYDLETGRFTPHLNNNLKHIYALCWSPDGNWFAAAIHGNREYSDTILAIEAKGTGVTDLERWGVIGCRPDFNFDGTKLAWGETDWNLCIADLNLTGPTPRVSNIKKVVQCRRTMKVYHVDFSPDGKYITFSHGPFRGGQQVGGQARGWDICVSDLSGKWVEITTDGLHNKEPDWVPVPASDSSTQEKPGEN